MADWLNILLRSISLVFILFFITKWMGKKRIRQLSIFDYITGFVLGSLAVIITLNPKLNFFSGVLAIFVWFIISFIFDFLSLKSKTIRNFIEGKSTIIIQEGKVMEDNMKKERFTTDDLLYHLRSNQVFEVADVEFALLEPTGELTVLPKTNTTPITAKDLNIQMPPKKEPQTVIMDGNIILESLANLSLNPGWLETELAKMNVALENVFLGQVDSDGQLTVDLYDDKITVPSPTEKPLLLATLSKIQADLELFALATDNNQSKQLYEMNAAKMEQLIQQIKPYLYH